MTGPTEAGPTKAEEPESIALLAADAWRRARAASAARADTAAVFWFERVLRLAPDDPRPRLELAQLLAATDPKRAYALFAVLAEAFDLAEAWAMAAALALKLGRSDAAGRALAARLSRHRSGGDKALEALAGAVTRGAAAPGWCGLKADDSVIVSARATATFRLDGVDRSAIGREDVRRGGRLDVVCDGVALIGSPIDLAAQRQVIGIADASAGAIHGWASRRSAPETPPRLVLRDARSQRLPVRTTRRLPPLDEAPFVTRWAFAVSGKRLADLAPPFRIESDSGALFGTPLDPASDAGAGAGRKRVRPRRRDLVPESVPTRRRLAIVIPAFRGTDDMAAVLDALADDPMQDATIIVVDDASPEAPLRLLLQARAREGRLRLVRHRRNRGFPAAVNTGLRTCRRLLGEADILLLNADTVVPPGALQRLHALLYAAPDIASVTPLSNEATIMSYPKRRGGNPCPDAASARQLHRIAARANGDALVALPTAIGFCMAIRHDALAATGPFDEIRFAQGYGEENDWCLRARGLGYRHVGAPGVYVGHRGGASFGAAGAALRERNLRRLETLHPGYHEEIEAHHRADPLHHARRRIDRARFLGGETASASVVLVCHDHGGGVARVVEDRIAAIRTEGMRPVLLQPDFSHLPALGPDRTDAPIIGRTRISDRYAPDYPNLLYDLAHELPALLRLLRRTRVAHVEFHHVMGHHPSIRTLASRLSVPAEHVVHDYAAFCKRVNLVGSLRRYCGEPGPGACTVCLAEGDVPLADPEPPRAFVAMNARWLREARTIRAPSADAARRLRRHFPDAAPITVTPWEENLSLPQAKIPPRGRRRIAVAGGIGPAKGYDVLLGCARDAASRDLPLDFVLIGAADGERALLDTGRVRITGPYREGDAETLIRDLDPSLGFLPSIWPETWCFALTELWRAGLHVLAFDLGAQAERIRATGRGTLLPLGLHPSRINDALLAWTPDLRDLPGRSPGSPDEIRSPALSRP